VEKFVDVRSHHSNNIIALRFLVFNST